MEYRVRNLRIFATGVEISPLCGNKTRCGNVEGNECGYALLKAILQ